LIEEGGLLGGLQMVEKASELGSVKASAFLGFGFYVGRDGLPQDYVLARKYLEVFISQASPGKTWLDIPEESLEKLQYNTKFTGCKALTAEKIARSMTSLEMIILFVEISKKYIPDIDDTSLEYDLRQLEIDKSGPICSDSQLLDIFIEATQNKLTEGELYQTIEKICLEYCCAVEVNS